MRYNGIDFVLTTSHKGIVFDDQRRALTPVTQVSIRATALNNFSAMHERVRHPIDS